jgi:hypothetical protein
MARASGESGHQADGHRRAAQSALRASSEATFAQDGTQAPLDEANAGADLCVLPDDRAIKFQSSCAGSGLPPSYRVLDLER